MHSSTLTRLAVEKRRHPRVAGDGLLSHVKVEGELTLALPIANISLGGAALHWDQPCSKGKNIWLEIVRVGRSSVRVVGRVVDVRVRSGRPASVRIRFNPLAETVTSRLYSLLQEPIDFEPVVPPGAPTQVELAPPSPWTQDDAERAVLFDFAAIDLESGAAATPASPVIKEPDMGEQLRQLKDLLEAKEQLIRRLLKGESGPALPLGAH